MDGKILEATFDALQSVTAPRFFATERGYHGRFYCALQVALGRHGIDPEFLLEMEYQKSARHALTQRPDIILHVPAEHSGAGVREGNVAVWALKHAASASDAREDFEKLDEMFRVLQYSLGFFVNIASADHHSSEYAGAYRDRLVCAAVSLRRGRPIVVSNRPLPLNGRTDR